MSLLTVQVSHLVPQYSAGSEQVLCKYLFNEGDRTELEFCLDVPVSQDFGINCDLLLCVYYSNRN